VQPNSSLTFRRNVLCPPSGVESKTRLFCCCLAYLPLSSFLRNVFERYRTRLLHIPEDDTLQSHRCENLKWDRFAVLCYESLPIRSHDCLSFSFDSGQARDRQTARSMTGRILYVSCLVRSVWAAGFNSLLFLFAPDMTGGVSNTFVLCGLCGPAYEINRT
jgi:hypothetical protein